MSIENARKPRASTADIGSPFAFGGVAGRNNANTAETAATPAPQANGVAVPSITVPKQLLPTRANTAAQIQPSEPNTRIIGNASGVLFAIAIDAVNPHVGIYAHIASTSHTKIIVGFVVKNAARSKPATSALRTHKTFSLFATLSANIPTNGEKIEPIAIVDIISENITPLTSILLR